MGLEGHQKEGVVFGQAKTILTEQFQNGEESRRKCDPQEVSKSMGLERDQGGARIFHPDEVLTAQQITSFFGRLAAKKQLLETTPTESDNDGNDSAAEAEAYPLCAQKVSLFSIRLCHPLSMYVSLFEGTN